MVNVLRVYHIDNNLAAIIHAYSVYRPCSMVAARKTVEPECSHHKQVYLSILRIHSIP